MKKVKGKVVDAKDNGGFHDLRAYRKAEAMIRDHDYKQARLYHLCFTDSTDKNTYLAVIKSLAEHLRKNNIRCQYKAGLEISKSGNLHMHVFILVEADLNNPDHILNRKPGEWLALLCDRKGIGFYLNHPRSPLHRGKDGSQRNYATVPKTKPEKVEDCCTWLQYLYKNRDKPKTGTVYFSSRPDRELRPEN
jgi:hypothetical protein